MFQIIHFNVDKETSDIRFRKAKHLAHFTQNTRFRKLFRHIPVFYEMWLVEGRSQPDRPDLY